MTLIGHSVYKNAGKAQTKLQLKRLSLLTLQLFEGKKPPTLKEFYDILGSKNRFVDAWGTEYQIQVIDLPYSKAYSWVSAGPDKEFSTEDDLKYSIPYQNGLVIDFTNTEQGLIEEGSVRDAL
ncbi:MAG: hypothetical protein M9962_02880 [Oligoflexia bacterium]|nr:hypothetical protein [Oligoflexia bacterium]